MHYTALRCQKYQFWSDLNEQNIYSKMLFFNQALSQHSLHRISILGRSKVGQIPTSTNCWAEAPGISRSPIPSLTTDTSYPNSAPIRDVDETQTCAYEEKRQLINAGTSPAKFFSRDRKKENEPYSLKKTLFVNYREK
ncbi:MAG: hypothetical protein LQ348_007520 [Seirophora lacunosa]|nr:MAG: hypothetical protein LQ348_007520 [Seirophora lacunosa]